MHKVSLRLTDEQYDFINEFRQVLTSQMGSKVGFSEALRYILHRNKNSITDPRNTIPKLAKLNQQQLNSLSELYTRLNTFANDKSLKDYEHTVSSNLNQLAYAVNQNQLPKNLGDSLIELQQTHAGVKQNLTLIKKELDDLNQVLHMITLVNESEPINQPAQPQGGVDDASRGQY